ncbi:MAG: hypothetical protein J2P59_02055 [Acidimicrobiales bacterium]|nr:hypothetical protein [Acidimicrobiales bacterium]
MAGVRYEPFVGPGHAIDGLLRSAGMRSFMDSAAGQAGQLARTWVALPQMVETRTVMSAGPWSRWEAEIWNTNPGALTEEYGRRGRKMPTKPLSRVLDILWAEDPNRRRKYRQRA